jgi:hypothetical protein
MFRHRAESPSTGGQRSCLARVPTFRTARFRSPFRASPDLADAGVGPTSTAYGWPWPQRLSSCGRCCMNRRLRACRVVRCQGHVTVVSQDAVPSGCFVVSASRARNGVTAASFSRRCPCSRRSRSSKCTSHGDGCLDRQCTVAMRAMQACCTALRGCPQARRQDPVNAAASPSPEPALASVVRSSPRGALNELSMATLKR